MNTYFVGVWGITIDDNKIPPYGTINIVINGVTYSSPVKIGNEGYWIYAGNKGLSSTNYEDTGENFFLQISSYEDTRNLDYTLYTVDEPVSVTLPNGNTADGAVISIEQDTSAVNTIDPKYIPSTTPPLYNVDNLTREQMIQFAKDRANVQYYDPRSNEYAYGSNYLYQSVTYECKYNSVVDPCADACDPCAPYVNVFILYAVNGSNTIFNIEITADEYNAINDAWSAACVN